MDKNRDLIRARMLEAPLFPLLLKTSVPSMLGLLIGVIYNLTDVYFIGLMRENAMTASIGIAFSYISLIQAIGFWFGYGSGNRMSRKLGEKNDIEAEKLSHAGLTLSVAASVILVSVSWAILDELVILIGGAATDRLFNLTSDYLKPIIISVPFTLYSITVYNQLRLCGYVNAAMAGLLIGMMSNVILDPILIFGLSMGFVGAGYASLLGQLISAVVLTVLVIKKSGLSIHFSFAVCTFSRIYHILVGGMPNFARQAISTVSLVLLNTIAASYGELTVAALTLSSRVLHLVYMLMVGWGQGFQPICAMNYGASRYDRVKKVFRLTVMTGTLFLLVSSLCFGLFAKEIISNFTKDANLIELSALILRIHITSLSLLCFFGVGGMLMQNVGLYSYAIAITISRQGYVFIPVLLALSTQFGQMGIFLTQPVSDVISFFISLYFVLRFFSSEQFK